MTLVAPTLADQLKNSLGFASFPTSSQNSGLAQGIVDEITMKADVEFAPGTVTGTVPPAAGPLTLGAATGGVISGMTPADLAAKLQADMGFGSTTSQLLGMANAIVTHFLTALASFAVGTITGACTNTPATPGVFVGAGAGGTIAGLSGSGLASLMAADMGFGTVSAQLLAFSNTLVTYLLSNSVVTIPPGGATGVAPAGGGPLTAGAATGGTIS